MSLDQNHRRFTEKTEGRLNDIRKDEKGYHDGKMGNYRVTREEPACHWTTTGLTAGSMVER